MADNKENKTPKRRTQAGELPKEERELSGDEQKKVKGGGAPGNFGDTPGLNGGDMVAKMAQ